MMIIRMTAMAIVSSGRKKKGEIQYLMVFFAFQSSSSQLLADSFLPAFWIKEKKQLYHKHS